MIILNHKIMIQLLLSVVLLLLLGTYFFYKYTNTKYRCINYIVDIYLNYKYKNYHYQSIDKEYKINKMVILSIDCPYRIKTLDISHDLRRGPFWLDCDHLRRNMDNYEFTRQTVIYIHFIYGVDEYIIPYKYIPNGIMELPCYQLDDLDTCLRMEYNRIETKSYDSDKHDIMSLIIKYAGPKGNFYCDTSYSFEPKFICDVNGELLLENDFDFLKLTTIMGETVTFNANQTIKLN